MTPGKLILLLGGARSGKSSQAERMARQISGGRAGNSAARVLYVATAQAFDDEMRERIIAHRAARPPAWTTLEAPIQVAARLTDQLGMMEAPPDVIVLDCITLLASNALLALPDPENCSQTAANDAILTEIDALLRLSCVGTWIVVTNEVGMGVVPPYRLGRLYRDALGAANQRLALAADEVYLLVAGLPWKLK